MKVAQPKLCPTHNIECNAWSGKVCGCEVVEGPGRCVRDEGWVKGLGEDFASPFAGEGEDE